MYGINCHLYSTAGISKALTEEALAAKDSEAEEALALSITEPTNE
jgi:hypothetical protein